jgi:hypothetical protein
LYLDSLIENAEVVIETETKKEEEETTLPRRTNIVLEILETERAYVNSLYLTIKVMTALQPYAHHNVQVINSLTYLLRTSFFL